MDSSTPFLLNKLLCNSFCLTPAAPFGWFCIHYQNNGIIKTKCRNTWGWNGSCCCLVPLTLCACQSKSIAVFCWFLSTVNISALKAFGNHTYNVISIESHDTPCRFFPTEWKTLFCIFLSSPSGKLVQIEYALAAVAAGAPSVGIKGRS